MPGRIANYCRLGLAGMAAAVALVAATPAIPVVKLSTAAWTQVALPEMPLGVVAHDGVLWVCGAQEMIAASADGGRTWTLRHENPGGEMLFGISFVDDHAAYAMGSGGIRLQTLDGGAHWKNLRSTVAVRDIQFTGLKYGFGIFNGMLLSTTDSGWHWNESLVKGDRLHDDRAQELVALDQRHAVAWLNFTTLVPKPAGLVATSDGGQHWALSRLAPTLTAGGVVVQQGKYHLYASDRADAQHPRQVHLISSDGSDWQDAAAPPVAYTDCARQGCRTPDGWVGLTGGLPAYYRLPTLTAFTHEWASAGSTVCQVGEYLECALATAEAVPGVGAAPPPTATVDPSCQACPDPTPTEGLDGEVEIWIAIDSQGGVSQPQVIEATWAALVAPSLKAIRRWRFHPARHQGVTVPSRAVMQFMFGHGRQ